MNEERVMFQVVTQNADGSWRVVDQHHEAGEIMRRFAAYVARNNCIPTRVIHSGTRRVMAESYDIRTVYP